MVRFRVHLLIKIDSNQTGRISPTQNRSGEFAECSKSSRNARRVRYTLKTYPVEINFGETPQQRKQRTFMHEVAEAATKHQSARLIGSCHVGDAPSKERRRRTYGQPSVQCSRDLEARKQYVRLYIEYTAAHGPHDLYLDAIAYLKELEAEKTVRGIYDPVVLKDTPRSGTFPLQPK